MFAEKHLQGSKRKFRSTRFRDRSLTRILRHTFALSPRPLPQPTATLGP